MHPWHDVTPGQNLPVQFAAVVEIPMGSTVNKALEGKSVEVDDFEPASAAYPVIEHALQEYTLQRRQGFHVKPA